MKALSPVEAELRESDAELPLREGTCALHGTSEDATKKWIQDGVNHAAEMEETSRLILESAGDGIYGLDIHGFVTFVNPAAYRMTGWTLEDLRGKTQHSLVHHTHADGRPYPRETCPIYQAIRDGVVQQRDDEVFWRKDGTSFAVAYTSTPLWRRGELIGAVVLFRDITREVRARGWEQGKLRIFQSILEDRSLQETLQLLARAAVEVMPTIAVYIEERIAGHVVQGSAQGAACVLLITEPSAAESARVISLSAHTGELLGSITIIGEEAGVCPEYLSIEQQLTQLARLAMERSHMTARLLHQAKHDALTGLPNRLLLEDRLEQAIALAKRHDTVVGVCYIDLDRFKDINDTLGHNLGDRYLQIVSETLRMHCRQVDTLARQGGDEFILVLPELQEEAEAQMVCNRLLAALHQPIELGGEVRQASASIGISLYPHDGESPAEMLRNADIALYAAKRAGRDQSIRFSHALGQQSSRHAKLSADIRRALANDEFFLQYQPLYDRSMEIEGFETLLRWRHPQEGLISPGEFIPVAEETTEIVEIGAWVLRSATRQAMEWTSWTGRALRIYVNVSGVQLSRPGLADVVTQSLQESGLPASQLELEVTESIIISNPELARTQLGTLRALGLGISMDDFGTGQSSLSCLHQLPLDTLKIDQSFVARLSGGQADVATVGAIVALARQLGLKTVAEGVETPEQLRVLQMLECDMLQGFLMSRPLNPDAVRAALTRDRPDVTPGDLGTAGQHAVLRAAS